MTNHIRKKGAVAIGDHFMALLFPSFAAPFPAPAAEILAV